MSQDLRDQLPILLNWFKIKVHYHTRVYNQCLEDPSKYIESIPWGQLAQLGSSQSHPELLTELNLDIKDDDEVFFLVWETNYSAKYSYTLYMTEDLYAHQVLENYAFSGTFLDRKIVSACRPLEKSLLCQNLRDF